MRLAVLLSLLCVAVPASARRTKAVAPVVQKVPSIDEVVSGEGFVPTPSQSETYRPGVVLVPNAQGGHDEVHPDCIGVAPTIKIMSQSSIATSLSAGVSARLTAVRGQVAAGVERRLSFVDPEQRTIPLSALNPSEACVAGLETAARFTDLSQAIVVYDVLVAQIQNIVCTRADASGRVMLLGEAEAAAFSECVQESDAQVPLGFKSVPLSKVLAAGAAVPGSAPALPSSTASPLATGAADFGGLGQLDVDTRLGEQACLEAAQSAGAAARAERLAAAEEGVQAQATTAWQELVDQLDKCTQLPRAQRSPCIALAEQWLAAADRMSVSLDAGVERVQTACGEREAAFVAESRPVLARELDVARGMLARLTAAEGVAFTPGKAGIEWVDLGAFEISRSEVTVAQYRACMRAGACSEPATGRSCNWGHAGRDDHPINCVDWYQARAFSKWAGGRLPTGDEWTYAATSGGNAQAYPWGDEEASCARAVMDDGGWGCGEGRTWPVCSKPAGNSRHGLCDLAGNVWEWTQESPGASIRVFRGGGWFYTATFLRASSRVEYDPSDQNNYVGFRAVR